VSLKLVNTAPGDESSPMKPGQAVFLGLRSTTLGVDLGSLVSHIGLSSVQQGPVSPEQDPHLTAIQAAVLLETPERIRPIVGQASRTFPGTGMLITKNSNNGGEQSVFEVKVPVRPGATVLAHFKLRIKNAWQLFQPSWCYLTNMTGLYLGLEHGTFNTAAYVFLRKNAGVGSVVYGGPQQTANSARPAQTELAYDWTTVGDNGLLEVFILFNTYSNPFQIEIWAKKPADPAPVVIAQIPYLTLGTFPTPVTHAENARPTTDDHATIFFGMPGLSGDQLQIDDWTLYPDYRFIVGTGQARTNANVVIRPDLPVIYRADANLLPTESLPSRWFPYSTVSSPPGVTPDAPSLYYQPGRRTKATAVRVPKTTKGGVISFYRNEPRLGQVQDGAMIEAFISGNGFRVGECFGAGLCIDDGAKKYKVMMVENASGRSYAISKDQLTEADTRQGYYLPTTPTGDLNQIDFHSPKLIRLVVDRRRGVVDLYSVDERTPILTVPLASIFPISAGENKIEFGHLTVLPTIGYMDVQFLNYLSTYIAWEGRDGLMPDDAGLDAGARFTPTVTDTGGSSSISNGVLTIFKKSINTSLSKRFYKINQSFDIVRGIQVDFAAKVLTYNAASGEQFGANSPVGAGVTLYLGTKRLQIDFFDCGIYGRRIGVIPGSGSLADILNQTPLGKKYSAPVDWTLDNYYRVVVRPYESISIYTGSVAGDPALVLPWIDDTTGFDLPLDITTPGLAFGHFNELTSTTMNWSYIRWGLSHGYDVSISHLYPDGYPSYLFSGKELVLSDFNEA
jgi:hypothetical protein